MGFFSKNKFNISKSSLENFVRFRLFRPLSFLFGFPLVRIFFQLLLFNDECIVGNDVHE